MYAMFLKDVYFYSYKIYDWSCFISDYNQYFNNKKYNEIVVSHYINFEMIFYSLRIN